jgi:hypothetical protein
MPPPVAVTVIRELPTLAAVPFVRVSVERPLPGDPRLCGLRPTVIPVGAPETLSAIADANPPKAEVVNATVPLLVFPLTETVAETGVSVKPGTLTVKLEVFVIPPPVAVTTMV